LREFEHPLQVRSHRPTLNGDAFNIRGESGMADGSGAAPPGSLPQTSHPKNTTQDFFLALAAKGKDEWNAWRRVDISRVDRATGVEPRMSYRASIEQLMLNHIPAGQRECQHREKK
jgi:hypothetical protein